MNILKINGRDYVLKFTFSSHIKMQEAGINFDEFEVNGMPNFAMVRDFLYYGLEKFHKLSREEVEDLIDTYLEEGGTLETLLGAVVDSYTKSLGVKKDQIIEVQEKDGKKK